MNVYHITHSPQAGIIHLHFWGCNLNCRACLLKKELYDCHLVETKDEIFRATGNNPGAPERFLELEEVMHILESLEVRRVILMGAEPTTDRQLPQLAEALHDRFQSHNVLLTNGFIFAELKNIDEVVFSLKACNNDLHRHYTGESNEKALANFIKYHQSGVRLRAESIFIPEYLDCSEIEHISRFIAGVDRGIPYRIDAYIPIGDNPWRRPTPEETARATSIARRYLDNVSCLTGNEELKFDVVRVI
ncbi:MAG: radical SAM protein [Chloroflexota bacterium]